MISTTVSGPALDPLNPAHDGTSTGSRRAIAVLRPHAAIVLIVALTGAGLMLRLAAARGDLWLDELWSLDLVSRLTSPDQVFWAISHDNNHFLNSLWMYVVGQGAGGLAYRWPSIILSTAAIVIAARIGGRVNAAGAVGAAALTACSYVVVDYGSEARGYAGLIVAVLLAIDLSHTSLNRMLAGCPSDAPLDHRWLRRQRWGLAAVLTLGVCAHLTMAVEAAILGLSAIVRIKLGGRTAAKALDEAVTLFRPAILALLPIVAVIGVGIAVRGQFTVGGYVPYTPQRFVEGYGGLLSTMLGLPSPVPPLAGLLVSAAIIITALATRLLDSRWSVVALTAMVVWPAAMVVAHVPNTEYARYFLPAGVFLPVFLAEIAGRLWGRGGLARWCGAAAILAICAGQTPHLRELLSDHRGSPKAAVSLMAAGGPTTFRARRPMMERVVDVYARQLGVDVRPVGPSAGCGGSAIWIVDDRDFGETAPATVDRGPLDCRSHYTMVADFPAALWSGQSWTLYRRSP